MTHTRRGDVAGRLKRWKHGVARWLDPQIAGPSSSVSPQVEGATTAPPRAEDVASYAALAEQFAVRILTGTYQMGTYLDTVEADEPDPNRLEQLYRLDHAVNRTRRQAENLLVLTGQRIEDAGRQVTPLLDVIRAATSTVEHYARVRIARVVDLAVVEFAADDIIRILTELVDNATRFSPPHSDVVLAAHVTDSGSVLVRVEDSGFGIEPAQLLSINATLASQSLPTGFGGGSGHLGFLVIHRLAVSHGLRVQLSNRQPGGVIATVVLPARMLCEIPMHDSPSPVGPAPRSAPTGPAWAATTSLPRALPETLAAQTPVAMSAAGLPVRQPTSLRETRPTAPAVQPSGRHRSAWPDDAADFAAGIEDARYHADSTTEGSAR